MDLFETMRSAPTTRRFKPEPVARETLARVLDGARFAPSGGNRQGWRVVIVQDAERRAALRDLYLPGWRAYMDQTGGAQVLADPDSFDPAIVRPDEIALAAHIGVGHRADPWPKRLARRPVSEFAFAERYGAPLA